MSGQPQQWNAAPQQGQPMYQQGQPQQWNAVPVGQPPQQQVYQQTNPQGQVINYQQQQQVYQQTNTQGQVVVQQQQAMGGVAQGGMGGIAVPQNMIAQYHIVQFSSADAVYATLEQNDAMHIQEMIDYTDLFIGLPMANRYLIQNKQGQTIMMAQEQSNMFARMMTSEGNYGFSMAIYVCINGVWQHCLQLTRPWVCRCC